MHNKRMKLLLVLFSLFLATVALAQEPTKTEKMDLTKLGFLHGNWSGEGWMISGKEEKHSFTVKTGVTMKLRGSVLVLDQEGQESEGANKGKPFMDLLGLISLNPEQNGFMIHNMVGEGAVVDGDGQLEGATKLVYAQVNGTTFARYTIEVQDGVWKQKGELTDDGKRFFTFMEMTMKKN
jgi:hypothetical protein